jgi:transcriptional regulator GlxA family with amidase domain
MSRTVAVLVFEGAEELDFVGPWEVLTASAFLREQAGEQPDRIVLVAERAEPLRCAKGLRVVPDVALADCTPDVVVVPGGWGVERNLENPVVLDWLAKSAATAEWTTSVCTGAFLLQASGVAEGRRLATHWMAEDTLAERGVDVARGVRWVQDGTVVSSQGVSAGIDMALWLVGQLYDAEHARAVQRYIQYDPAPPYAET